MAERGDITVNNDLNPRVATVAAPSTELTIQDYHDTLRKLEESLVTTQHPEYVSSAGKEALADGSQNGITLTQQNVVLAFEARKTWKSTGTITTPDVTGRRIIDSAATFQTDGVVPGAWVVNLTDGSICTVLIVVDETNIVTDFLGGGTDDQWDAADAYQIINVTQCKVTGGNLVSLDESGNQIDPIHPTAGTQVVIAASSSATLLSTASDEGKIG